MKMKIEKYFSFLTPKTTPYRTANCIHTSTGKTIIWHEWAVEKSTWNNFYNFLLSIKYSHTYVYVLLTHYEWVSELVSQEWKGEKATRKGNHHNENGNNIWVCTLKA